VTLRGVGQLAAAVRRLHGRVGCTVVVEVRPAAALKVTLIKVTLKLERRIRCEHGLEDLLDLVGERRAVLDCEATHARHEHDQEDDDHDDAVQDEQVLTIVRGRVQAEHRDEEHHNAKDDAYDAGRARRECANGVRDLIDVDLGLDDRARYEHDETADEKDQVERQQRIAHGSHHGWTSHVFCCC